MKITIEFDEELTKEQMGYFTKSAENFEVALHGGNKRYTLNFDYAWQLARVILELAAAACIEELPMFVVVQDESA